MTGDGGTIVFTSRSEDMTPELDRNGSGLDLFVWNRATGHVHRVTNGPVGLSVSGPVISGDGSVVLFFRHNTLFIWRPDG